VEPTEFHSYASGLIKFQKLGECSFDFIDPSIVADVCDIWEIEIEPNDAEDVIVFCLNLLGKKRLKINFRKWCPCTAYHLKGIFRH